jgi:carboxylesterase
MTTPVTVHPLAGPLSIEARPELTGARSIGVLLSHGFTGQPASIKPWGLDLADKGYAVEVPRLPGHGTSWQELNTTTWADWYGELARTFDKLCLAHEAVVVCGLSMGGALVLQLAADHPDRVAGVVVVNAAVATKRKDVKLLPLLKHVIPSFPAIGNDIKKPGGDEHAYSRTPLKATASMMGAWPGLIASLPEITCPLLYFRSTEDHVVDDLSQPIITNAVSSSEIVERRLENSYHVATLDNDAEEIFAESAIFIARITAV